MSNIQLIFILKDLEVACHKIYTLLKKSNLDQNSYTKDNINSSGEVQNSIDVESNNIFIRILKRNRLVNTFYSEELEKPIILNNEGIYNVFVDPLDGSGNIESNLNVGSIFTIVKNDNCKTGRDILCAGYCLYSYTSIFVYSLGKNNTYKKLLLQDKIYSIVDPKDSKYYCINEKFSSYNKDIEEIIDTSKSDNKTCRWSGCMVSDIHRIIVSGGNFVYPDKKLRLLYECYPMAFLIENLGGKVVDINKNNILDISFPDNNIHQKCSIIAKL
jgi:fructose-1,6-bisphosphatase I